MPGHNKNLYTYESLIQDPLVPFETEEFNQPQPPQGAGFFEGLLDSVNQYYTLGGNVEELFDLLDLEHCASTIVLALQRLCWLSICLLFTSWSVEVVYRKWGRKWAYFSMTLAPTIGNGPRTRAELMAQDCARDCARATVRARWLARPPAAEGRDAGCDKIYDDATRSPPRVPAGAARTAAGPGPCSCAPHRARQARRIRDP